MSQARLGWNTIWPALFFLALVVGQLVRLQLIPGSTGAVSALDLALIVSVLGYGIRLARRQQLRSFATAITTNPIWKWSGLFLAWAAVSLVLQSFEYSLTELAVATAYLIRLLAVFSLAWLVWFDPPPLGTVRQRFTGAAAALLVLGWLQFIFVPDFRFMVRHGWDPHVDRLLATFFDPNYFGVFLVLVMAISLARAFGAAGRARLLYYGLFIGSWAALYATYSRSAWLAGLLAVTPLAFRRKWWLGGLVAVVFIGSLFLPTRLSERFQNTQSLTKQKNFQQTKYTCDEFAGERCDTSGAQRVLSYERGVKLFQQEPLTGVGYNAYGYALVQRGLAGEERLESRSAQGSDSSLLTILATTGLLGLAFFVAFYSLVLVGLWRRSRVDWVAQGLFWFTLSWLAVSFFNNSLLYLSILAPWLVLVADTLRRDRTERR